MVAQQKRSEQMPKYISYAFGVHVKFIQTKGILKIKFSNPQKVILQYYN